MFRSSYRSIEIVSGPSFWRGAGCVALGLFVQTVFAPLLVVRGGIPSFVTIAVVLYALSLFVGVFGYVDQFVTQIGVPR